MVLKRKRNQKRQSLGSHLAGGMGQAHFAVWCFLRVMAGRLNNFMHAAVLAIGKVNCSYHAQPSDGEVRQQRRYLIHRSRASPLPCTLHGYQGTSKEQPCTQPIVCEQTSL